MRAIRFVPDAWDAYLYWQDQDKKTLKRLNLLITAGGTIVPIDRVRCIANSFTGRTGASIAVRAHTRGHVEFPAGA